MLTPTGSDGGTLPYVIPYAARVTATANGEASVPELPYSISAWVLPPGKARWVHLRIAKAANLHVYVTVNNETAADLGEYQYNGTLTNLKWAQNQLYGSWIGSAWAEVMVWAGLPGASQFVYGSGDNCMPRDPLSISLPTANLLAWYDFADPSATGHIARSGGWGTVDIAQNASSNNYTFLDATHPIPAGTVVTSASVYTAAGYNTEDAEICIYRKTGALAGYALDVKSLSISSSAGWHSAAFSRTIPDNGYDHFIGVYSPRTVSMTTNEGQGMARPGDQLSAWSDFAMSSTFRAPITKWAGYKPAGLGQDVSGNGNHWDLAAVQSTSTPTS
ncbi:hypothetical protein [Pseudodesulfovibrio indicus]|uniref:hypothetical protein n=1 Tax=Pseudodesulfovibrio indicus TaxID=1716143 RepID=UPI00292FD596|nr:hypothetical protein [Pseudodesulfovibrio indicus]